jgi:hypothetical protein
VSEELGEEEEENEQVFALPDVALLGLCSGCIARAPVSKLPVKPWGHDCSKFCLA